MSDTNAIQLAGVGPVAALERKLREHFGMRYAACMPSGTTGLLACALVLGLRRAEFVTTPYTWGGTIGPWLWLGHQPRFADIEPLTLGLDPSCARRAITTRTRAILAADIYGMPSDTEGLRRVADEHGVWYIADAAQGLGGLRNGRPASSLADLVVVSFTAGKLIDAGEGGAVLTSRDDLYERLVWLTQHPARQRRELGLDNEFGLNGRIHPWAAERACTTFNRELGALECRRRRCAQILELAAQAGFTREANFRSRRIEPTFLRLTAVWRGKPRPRQLANGLAAHGIRVSVGPAPVRPLYLQPAFQAQWPWFAADAHCPEAERQSRRRFAVAETADRCPSSTEGGKHEYLADVASR